MDPTSNSVFKLLSSSDVALDPLGRFDWERLLDIQRRLVSANGVNKLGQWHSAPKMQTFIRLSPIPPNIEMNYAKSFPEKKEKSGTFKEVPQLRKYEV